MAQQTTGAFYSQLAHPQPPVDARQYFVDIDRQRIHDYFIRELRFMQTIDFANLEFTVEPSDVDEDQFVSLWNVAASTMKGDVTQARSLASKFLGFLAKHRCGLVSISPSGAKYLDEWFERDESLLYDWKPESENVDVVAQHVHVPFDLFCNFLREHKFQGDKNYSPRRATRVEWFTDDWNVG